MPGAAEQKRQKLALGQRAADAGASLASEKLTMTWPFTELILNKAALPIR